MSETFSSTTSIEISAPVAAVWDALVNPETIKLYLYGARTVTDWHVGSPIVWQGEWEGKPYEDRGTVLEMEPQRRLSYTHWSPMSGTEEAPESSHEITCELSAHDDRITLAFTQGNGGSQQEVDDSVARFWAPALQTIKKVAEQ